MKPQTTMVTKPKYRRILAAVMFIDIVGYTALMQRDERQAIALRNRKRGVLERAVEQHDGEVRQYYGDGALVIFVSAYRAVQAAVEIQAELTKSRKVPVCIGIHLGDVVLDSEGVYGDAVNVAARIESLALPGSILVSGKVQAETVNQPEIASRPVGIFQFRHVEQPMKLFAVNNHLQNKGAGNVHSKWEEIQLKHTVMGLIHPYLININAGLTN